jgi:glycyl-tRNA synthetase
LSGEKESKADKISELAKRRGFFWPSSQIYGGVGGFFTYGDLGVKIRDKIIDLWKDIFVHRHQFVEIESSLVTPHQILSASGHVNSFKDPMAECAKCKKKFRADHLIEETGHHVSESLGINELERILRNSKVKCIECGSSSDWKVNQFMTMFKTNIGPYSGNEAFLRPETAQGMFVEFKRVYGVSREKLPIGIAQIGKAFRNEISPRQGMIRLREFSMMEVELFFDPNDISCPYLNELKDVRISILSEDMVGKGLKDSIEMSIQEALDNNVIRQEWLAYFMVLSKNFVRILGIPHKKQRFRAKLKDERAHYSAQTFDHEVFLDRFGWVEVAGHAFRTDHDLKSHMKASTEDLFVSVQLEKPIKVKRLEVKLDKAKIRKIFPDKIALILDRLKGIDLVKEIKKKGVITVNGDELPKDVINISEIEEEIKVRRFIPQIVEPSFGLDRLIYASLEYAYWEKEPDRVILRLPQYLTPIQVAIFPLMSKDGLSEKSIEIWQSIRSLRIDAFHDEVGSIGRRYARMDEIGVPFCVTVDYQTLEDGSVTIRERDTWNQFRYPIKNLAEYFKEVFFKSRQKALLYQ